MDIKSIRLIREGYLSLLANEPEYNNIIAALSAKPESEPLTNLSDVEAESDLSYNAEQRQLAEILLDMYAINNSIKETKDIIAETITDLDESLSTIRDSVKQQMEQVDDINMLCGQDSVYNMIIPIYVSDFGDTSAEMLDTKTIGASLVRSNKIGYDIVSVSGNGYSGNYFVYEDGEAAVDIDDRSKLEYISDENEITIYEYSRLCADKKQNVSSSYINYDNEAVECTITLSAEEKVCKAHIFSPDKSLCITRLETSDDGIRYVDRLKEPLYFNDVSKIYNDSFYVYGSNVLCFPYAKYVRISFSNREATDEEIRIEQDGTPVRVNVKRKRIALAGIELCSSVYDTAALVSQDILEDGNIDKISLFASEYIPDHFPDAQYIQYSLILNGKEYSVVPVNSGKEGITLIKYMENETAARENVISLTETIHTVQVKVIIEPYNNRETPYISNLKLCIGKNTGNIYV